MKCPNCENYIEDNSTSCEWCEINLQTFETEQKAKAKRLAAEKEKKEMEDALNKAKEDITVFDENNSDSNNEEATFVELINSQKSPEVSDSKQQCYSKKKIIQWIAGGIIAVSALLFFISWIRNPCKRYDSVSHWGLDGMIRVEKNGYYGYVKNRFWYPEVVPLKYDKVYFFKDGLLPVLLNDKFGVIDKKGNEVIPIIYDAIALDDSAPVFMEGLVPVKKNEKWGYIDKTNKTIIPFQYEQACSFTEGLAAVQLQGIDGKWGFIDRNGNNIIPFQFDNIYTNGHWYFSFGEYNELGECMGMEGSKVLFDGEWVNINKKGETVHSGRDTSNSAVEQTVQGENYKVIVKRAYIYDYYGTNPEDAYFDKIPSGSYFPLGVQLFVKYEFEGYGCISYQNEKGDNVRGFIKMADLQ